MSTSVRLPGSTFQSPFIRLLLKTKLCDVSCFLSNRFYKLHTKGLCEIIPMTVPRKVNNLLDNNYNNANNNNTNNNDINNMNNVMNR